MSRSLLSQQRPSQSQVPIQFFNTESDKYVPAFGAMIIVDIVRNSRTFDLIVKIRRCTEEDEKLQDHSMVIFNDQIPVAPRAMGTASMSLPSLVLVGRYGDDDAIPERSCCVGPARDSWLLWKGGGTHNVRYVVNQEDAEADEDITLLALVVPNTSPGLWIKTKTLSGVSDSGDYVTGTATLQNREPESEGSDNGSFVNAESGEDDKTAMEIEFIHGGGDIEANQIGQVKLVSGKWALDVQYCE